MEPTKDFGLIDAEGSGEVADTALDTDSTIKEGTIVTLDLDGNYRPKSHL